MQRNMSKLILGDLRRFGARQSRHSDDCFVWATEATGPDRKAVIRIARAFEELGREFNRSAALMVDCRKTLDHANRLMPAPRCDGWFARFLLGLEP
jgi:hypothetical protein